MQHAVINNNNANKGGKNSNAIFTGLMLSLLSPLSLMSFNANALDLANQPLNMSGGASSVSPNVMLLMDNSGSMKNMMWQEGFDPDASYANWNAGKSPSSGKFTGTHPDTGTSYEITVPTTSPSTWNTDYINFLFEFAFVQLDSAGLPFSAGTTADLSNTIPGNTRMQAAKNVATTLVTDTNNSSMRFGTFTFNNGQGGTLVTGCGSNSPNSLTSGISNLSAGGGTPLSETFHDITKYFRDSTDSPIQYRCQQNFVIVVTDGFPSKDDGLNSSSELAKPFGWQTGDPIPDFPNWDGVSNDGSGEKVQLLDDLAKFGYDIDLMPDGSVLDQDLDANGNGQSFNAAPYAQQNLVTHTIGFAFTNKMLEDAADSSHGRGTFNSTASETGLSAALNDALMSINASAPVKSVASVAVNSGSISSESIAYRVSYAQDWTGMITPYNLSSTTPAAGTAFAIPASRTIYTYAYDSATTSFSTVSFNDTSLPQAEKNIICPSTDTVCDSSTKVTAMIEYLGGSDSNEGTATGKYRVRSSKLGDIINSAPAYVAVPNYRYPDTLTSQDGDEVYSKYKTDKADRDELLVVGSNDGMLHAFKTSSVSNGTRGNISSVEEVMAYIPRMVLPKLKSLADQAYSHEYFVDGSPTIGDAFYDSTWHTVLASGMNKGAQGVFGLDLTNTSDFSGISPWEFTDANDSNMGYSFSQPAIVLMANGKWAAVFGNGYNSSQSDTATGTGDAVLYIVYLGEGEDGFSSGEFEVLNTNVTDTSQGTDNGLSTVTPIDIDGDSIIDIIYAGDLNGNMWKFNVQSTTASDWKTTAKITKLYSTCSSLPCEQSITTKAEVGRGPKSNSLMVYFGTGKYLQDTDPADTTEQAFYAILDESASNTTAVTVANLTEQTITQQSTSFTYTDPSDGSTKTNDSGLRITSNTSVDYGGASPKKGWFMKLSFNSVLQGERVVTNPILRNGRIIFATNFYSSTGGGNGGSTMVCSAGGLAASGQGWIMELDALNGGSLAYSPFDINNDGQVDIYDTILNSSTNVNNVSGKHFGENIATPTIVANGNSEVILTAGSDGGTGSTPGNAGPGSDGIQGWTQL